jgi:acetyl coenzyme A synthetase (ADP forming)-like protein
LKNGSLIEIKHVTPSDRQRLSAFVSTLSPGSFKQRFFDKFSSADELINSLMPAEKEAAAFIAVREDVVAGHVLLIPEGDDVHRRARIYVVVADKYAGMGIGTILVQAAVSYASEHGFGEVTASVLPDNTTLLKLIEKLGFPYKLSVNAGIIDIRFSSSNSEESRRIFETMEMVSVRNALSGLFGAKRIAVVGASTKKGTIGWQLLRNIIEGGYTGVVYPVNDKYESVQSMHSYKTVSDCPVDLDVVIIAVPARYVQDVALQSFSKGVRTVVVISSGFAEMGTEEGRRMQDELYSLCLSHGVRLVGPNCMGFLNTDPAVSLNAQFAPLQASAGNIGFFSQSGALGIAVMAEMNNLGLGLSQFISAGNKADISGNDLLEFWEQDERTSVILMYLESFGNPRKFASIAKRVSLAKPIVAVKSGRSRAGSRAALSHTGSIVSGSDITVDTLFRQTGVLRAETLGEMFDIASILTTQPLPKGKGVAIVTNAGGAGILTADACELSGLEVVNFSTDTTEKLRSSLSPLASVRNPVDMSAGALPGDYFNAISTVCQEEKVGSVIVIFVPPINVSAKDVSERILAAADANMEKTIVSVFIASKGVTDILSSDKRRIPSFHFPEEAVNALAKVNEYATWRNSPKGTYPPVPGGKIDQVASVISSALAKGREWLNLEEIRRLLSSYGIEISEFAECKTPSEAAQAASKFGGRVVLKIISPDVIHKSDVGGVKVNLDIGEVETEAALMKSEVESKGKRVAGFLIQPMAEQGTEMFVGVTNDGTFGPVVACGYGGTSVELFKDISVRLPPISDADASAMIRSLKSYPLLTGFRGSTKKDVSALSDLIIRIGSLVRDVPEIFEMDLNPVIVHEEGNGLSIVDARIRIQKVERYGIFGMRRNTTQPEEFGEQLP